MYLKWKHHLGGRIVDNYKIIESIFDQNYCTKSEMQTSDWSIIEAAVILKTVFFMFEYPKLWKSIFVIHDYDFMSNPISSDV